MLLVTLNNVHPTFKKIVKVVTNANQRLSLLKHSPQQPAIVAEHQVDLFYANFSSGYLNFVRFRSMWPRIQYVVY